MKNWKQIAIHADTSIKDALNIIDRSTLQIALVIDEHDRLLGTVTDGDVRRGLLRGVNLEEQVKCIYNNSPITASIDHDPQVIIRMMEQRYIRQVPVVDHEGRVVRIELLKEVLQARKWENLVVLMAGGLGSRLKPLTDSCPKPLLRVGGKPILEIILESFVMQGFTSFCISVNYKSEMIKEYFGDGTRWGISIEYLEEGNRMGTAGALSLLPARPSHTLIVMNGDLLTNVNFEHLLNFHNSNSAQATMCVREFVFQVPFGVVEIDKHRLISLDEKPVQRFLVNAGIYLIEPDLLPIIPQDSFFNMTDLFQKICERNLEVVTFPIREYWMDIGQVKDLERANGEFLDVFTQY